MRQKKEKKKSPDCCWPRLTCRRPPWRPSSRWRPRSRNQRGCAAASCPPAASPPGICSLVRRTRRCSWKAGLWIRINLSCWIQEGKNDPQYRKSRDFTCFDVLNVLFRGLNEGFSCSLCILYGGLRISKLQVLIQKIWKSFTAVNFYNFWSSKPWIRNWIRKKKSWIRIRIKLMRIHNPAEKTGARFSSLTDNECKYSQRQLRLMIKLFSVYRRSWCTRLYALFSLSYRYRLWQLTSSWRNLPMD